MFDKIIILLIEIGFGIKLNIVGEISLSELLLIASALFYIKGELFIRYPVLKKMTWLYIGLLLSQILSEIVVGNSFVNASKGFAVTIVSYFHVMFLFSLLIKNRQLINYVIIGVLIKSLVFGAEFEGDVSEVVEGEGAVFLKYYLAPIIVNIGLLVSVFFEKKIVSLLFILIGLLFMVLGARSMGVMVILTGLASLFIVINTKAIKSGRMMRLVLVLGCISYGLYTVYVGKVLKGEIKSGNASQLALLDNPYNPINLLIMGRTEIFVGAIAFLDKPLFGHGAWAKDNTGVYEALMLAFKDSDNEAILGEMDIIPDHSVLIGSGMRNGIFAFLFLGGILVFFIRKGMKSFNREDPYIILTVYFLLYILWNGLFSPMSHFRITLPSPFAFLMVCYILNTKQNIE